MYYPYLVVQAFHESERHFIIWMAITYDAVPVSLNHGSKLFKGLEALPLQPGLPVLKELPGPRRVVIVPQLAKRLFEHISSVEPFIGFQQKAQRAAALQVKIGFV